MHQAGGKSLRCLLPLAGLGGWRKLQLPLLAVESAGTHLRGDLGEKIVVVGPRCCELKVEAWVMPPVYCMQ